MKSPSLSRTTADLSESITRQLNMYVLAASAAGVGMLALVQPAEAKIVYTPAHVKITGKLALDLNHDGINDFYFSTNYNHSTNYSFAYLVVEPGKNQNQLLDKDFFPLAIRAGVRVGGAQHFSSNGLMAKVLVNNTNGHIRFEGDWANSGKGVKNRYLGLKFLISGKIHYGWARLNVTINSFDEPEGTLTGYAYETVPGKAIIAGATKGPDDAEPTASRTPTPEPATLGTLALGAPALSIWRREA
jgi:hypothetical protein